MNAVGVGPFVFAADRFAALLGIFAFLICASILSRRIDPRIRAWSSWSLLVGLIAARLVHVGAHWDSFAQEPWRIIAIWQGGFHLAGGLVGVLIVSATYVRSIRMGLATAGTLGLALLVWGTVHQLTQATLGQPAPTIALQQLDGPPITLSDTRGKPTVVNIWATWCPPCRREMPLLAEIAAKRQDVTFLFVNLAEGGEAIRAYLASENLQLDHVLLDQGMEIPRHYGAMGVPVTLFLRSDNTLATMHIGEISREALITNIDKIAGAT